MRPAQKKLEELVNELEAVLKKYKVAFAFASIGMGDNLEKPDFSNQIYIARFTKGPDDVVINQLDEFREVVQEMKIVKVNDGRVLH